MNELPETVLQRRAANLLEIRFATLARAGKPIAGAYVNRIPPLRVVWSK